VNRLIARFGVADSEEEMMKRFPLLILSVLLTALNVSAQDRTPDVAKPSIKLVAITLLVKDYDEAAKWYSENLGFEVRDNKDLRPGKRWVAMFSKDVPNLQIFLLKPGDGYMPVAQSLPLDRIGKETFWILRTNDFDAFVKHLQANGVRFRSRTYDMSGGGKEIVIEDLYGNLWVVQQVGAR
jgi:catechol 2,3-dioxygenase-like lactoylglutathione lyase family enzyme